MRKLNLILLFILVVALASAGSVAQAAQCPTGQALCDGVCRASSSTAGATCGGAATGHTYTDQCGTCACSSDPTTREARTSCTLSSPCIVISSCQPGTTFNACTNQCETPYTLRNPSIAQGDYISVRGTTLAVETASPPEGSLFYNDDTNSLRVKTGSGATDWKDVGTNYTAERNIDTAKLANNLVAVVGDPTFDKLRIGVPATTLIDPGNLALNSGSSISLVAPTDVTVDTNLKISGPVQARANSLGLTLNAPTGKNSELRLSQSSIDKWALSLRTPSSNFEIWRNEGGVWKGAPLQISNSTGLVSITNNLKVGSSATALAGNEGLGVEKNLFVGGVSLLQGDTAVREGLSVGEDVVMNSGKAIVLNAPRTTNTDTRLVVGGTIRGDADSLGLAVNAPAITNAAEVLLGQRNAYRWALSLRPDVEYKDFAIWRNLTGAEGAWVDAPLQISNTSGNVTLSHDLKVLGKVNGQRLVLSQTVPPTLDRSERLVVFGNAYVDSNLRINGTLNGVTSFSSATLDLTGTGAVAMDTGSGGGILRVGSASGNNILRVSGNEISTTLASPLRLQASSTGLVYVKNNLQVDGDITSSTIHSRDGSLYLSDAGASTIINGNSTTIMGVINAGSTQVSLTTASGELKTAELANEDWDTTAEGRLIIGASSGVACTTVCSSHGLNCADGFGLTGTQYGCSATPSVLRQCWCKG